MPLLAPIEPPTIRDFSVFEQHIEGAIKTAGDPDAPVPAVWYERPYCYFSNPYAITGPGEDIRMAPGTRALDLELEVAAIIGRAGRNLRPEEAGAHIAGYTIFNDWSARDIGGKEVQTPFGQCKGKDFANTLGPWIVTPDELEPYRDGDRYDLEMRAFINGAELGGDTLANMAWSFEEMVAYASRGTWVRPGDVLGSGTCGSGCLLELWGRRGSFEDPPPLAGRRRRDAARRGDRRAHQPRRRGASSGSSCRRAAARGRAHELRASAPSPTASHTFAGLVIDDRVIGASTADHLRAAAGLGPRARAARGARRARAATACRSTRSTVRPPSRPSGQILCAGANYRRHLRQMHYAFERRHGNDAPEDELRAASAAYVERARRQGHAVRLRRAAGRALRRLRRRRALRPRQRPRLGARARRRHRPHRLARAAPTARCEHVAGYTISNDISTRDVMDRPNFPMTDFVATKLRPTFFPTGPTSCRRGSSPDPYDLRITLRVNGEVMQDESTADIIFGVERLIEYASTMLVLRPGDLLLTGSPPATPPTTATAGSARATSSRARSPGSGTQRNRCVDESAFTPA